jgi:hypothetical protein
MTTITQTDFDRAVQAEPQLHSLVRMVNALCVLVRPSDSMCSGCIWESILKPLVEPMVGWGRGYPPKSAKDPVPYAEWGVYSAAELVAYADLPEHSRIPATTETERWLRSSAAYDGFTRPLIAQLQEADPAHGCGIHRRTT